jgi:hypothetical protein
METCSEVSFFIGIYDEGIAFISLAFHFGLHMPVVAVYRRPSGSCVQTGDPAVKFVPSFLALALAAAFVAAPSRAADLEYRTYSVTVDSKPAGDIKMTMQGLDDGSQLMAAQSVLTVKRGGGTSRSSFRSLETWKGRQLQKYEAFSEDEDKKRHLVGNLADGKFRVTVNGQRHDVHGDVWTTSFWFVPALSAKSADVKLMDIEIGKELAAKLEYAGTESRTVIGATVECSHYRLRGESIQAELWYDGSDRLLRSEVTAGARKTVLDLAKVQK